MSKQHIAGVGGGGRGKVVALGPLTGTWTGLETYTQVTDRKFSALSLVQNGDTFSGTYRRCLGGDSPVYSVTGSLNGSSVSLLFRDSRRGDSLTRSFSGTLVDDNTIRGLMGVDPATFTR